MDYSNATFHIAGDFVAQSQGVATKQDARTKAKPKKANRRRSHSFKLQRPKNLPKLCRWQEKCSRVKCTFVHLTPEILKGAKKPYRVCWAHPHCKATHCPYIHYSGQEVEDNVKKSPRGDNPHPTNQQADVPSHLPQSFVCISRGRYKESEDEEEEDLRQRIERLRPRQGPV